ncbi:MAG TPA: hypothetical protein VFG50_05340 [Rhodothermales bacterium]|nr:hypothetical protein [Rhodothermales bacterium]
MTVEPWLSIGLGASLGIIYGALAYLINRYAMQAGRERFFQIVFGGIVVRMLAALGVLAFMLVAFRVRTGVLVGAFLTVFVVATILELRRFHRMAKGTSSRAD